MCSISCSLEVVHSKVCTKSSWTWCDSNQSSDELLLDGDVEDYEFLNKSRREIDGVDDREEWSALKVSYIGTYPLPYN